MTAFNVASLPVTGTIALVVGAITALILIGVALIANWEDVKKACKNFIKTFTDNFNKLKSDLSGVMNSIIQSFNNMKNRAGEALSNLWKTGKDNFIRLKNDLTSAISSAKDSVVSKANEMKNSAGNAISGFIQTGINNFNKLKSDISNIMSNIKSTISNVWSNITGIFSRVLKPNIKMPKISISGKFSLNPPSVPKFGISWYSKGAIFKRPTVLGGMGVGDKHNGIGSNAEAILPINQLPKLLGLDKMQNNNGIALNIENFNNNTDKDIEYLANELAFYMRRKNIGMGGAY